MRKPRLALRGGENNEGGTQGEDCGGKSRTGLFYLEPSRTSSVWSFSSEPGSGALCAGARDARKERYGDARVGGGHVGARQGRGCGGTAKRGSSFHTPGPYLPAAEGYAGSTTMEAKRNGDPERQYEWDEGAIYIWVCPLTFCGVGVGGHSVLTRASDTPHRYLAIGSPEHVKSI